MDMEEAEDLDEWPRDHSDKVGDFIDEIDDAGV